METTMTAALPAVPLLAESSMIDGYIPTEEWPGVTVLAVAGLVAIVVVSVVFGALKSMYRARQREQSRREIAAYVAEGSMSPEDGERLLRADMPWWERSGKKC